MIQKMQATAALLHEEGAAAQVYVAHTASTCHANPAVQSVSQSHAAL